MTRPDPPRRLNARLPADAYRALEQLAAYEARSTNAQLIVAVEGWLFGHGPDWYRRLVTERNAAMHSGGRGL